MITFFGVICELFSKASSNNASDSVAISQDLPLALNKKQTTYVSFIMGWAAALGEFQYRRLIETWYVHLKVDLDISGSLNQTRTKLLAHLVDDTIFSKEFVAFFSTEPLDTLDTDPDQIVKIKKILRALYNLEHGIDELLDINLSPDRSIVALHYYDLLPNLRSLANTLATELNVLNQGSADVEILIGSYVNPLMSKLNALIAPLDFRGIPIPSVGQVLKLLPESTDNVNQGLENLSALIYQLPVYFQELQTLIDPNSLKKLSLDDSKIIKIKTNKLLNNLKKLATGDGLALLPSGISTVKLLLNHLPTLLNSSGHFTQESHKKLEKLLNQLRHEHLPNIIAELESVEQHFSLRPNLLVEPVLKPMNGFYTKLASLSEYWVTTSNVMDETINNLTKPKAKIIRSFLGDVKPVESTGTKLKSSAGIGVLCDDEFINVVRSQRVTHWIESDFTQRDKSAIEAAERFFKNATACFDSCEGSWTVMELLTGTVKEAPIETINALKKDYKIIQPYYAKLYPELDVLFVNNFPLWLERFNRRESPVNLIKQTMAQAAFKCKSLEINSAIHDQIYRPNGDVSNFMDLLKTNENKKKITENAGKMNGIKNNRLYKSLVSVGDKAEYKPPLYRALADKPSIKLKNFIEGDLKAWLEKCIDPDIFSKLSFEPEQMIDSALIGDQIQTFKDIPSAFFYKKLLCSLAMIQKDLVKLEGIYEQQVSSTELLTTLITDKALWINVYYATLFIGNTVSSPELGEVVRKGLKCLEPLKNIPVLGDYVNALVSPPADKPRDVEDDDMVARWKQQAELVKQTLTGQPAPKEELSSLPPSSPPQILEKSTKKTDKALPEEDILLLIAKQIYRTPQLIRKFNPDTQDAPELSEDELDTKASKLMAAIKISKCNFDALKKILSSVNELNNALINIGVETKSVVIAIENKLRLDILSSADEAEFQLSYKPGTITSPLNDMLSTLFRELMIDFPISTEEKFELIGNTGFIDKRIEVEKIRLNTLPKERDIKLPKMKHDLIAGYQELRHLESVLSFPPIAGKTAQLSEETKDKFLRAYQKLQPYLYQIKTIYDPVLFLRELQSPNDFKRFFDDIRAMKGKVFLLVEQEKNGFDDMTRRCDERIKFLEQSKTIQKQNAMKTKHTFQVDLLLRAAFYDCNNELNIKTKSRIAKHFDPIISVFQLIINVLALEKKLTAIENKGNIIEAFDLTKKKWNADCATKIRERAKKMEPDQDLEKQIRSEVNQLYSDYFQLIDMYKQLEIMQEYINLHPSSAVEVDNEKVYWINILKEGLSKHDVPPRQRLINIAIIGLGKDCKAALEKKADRFFIRLVHKLYKLLLGLETPEKKSRVHLQKKFEAFKNQKNEEQSKSIDKSPPSSQ